MQRRDPRPQRSAARVHEAVCEVLVRDGPAGLTVDALAAASGVSRSTIYRRWPDLAALTCEVFADLIERDPLDLPADPVEAIGAYLADYARRLNDPVYTAVLVALVEGSTRDATYAEVHRQAFSQTRSRAGDIVRRARRAGLIHPGLGVQQCVEDLVAPFLYRRLVMQRRITATHVTELQRLVLLRWSVGP